MECNFCKNILQTQLSLERHKKSNKKCLEIQKKNTDNIITTLVNCDYCLKDFSTTNINRHIKVCSKKLLKDNNEQLEIEHKNDIENIERRYKDIIERIKIDYEKQIQELKNHIIKIETENSIFKEDRAIVTEIAKQPKYNTNTNNTNTNNITNNLAVFDTELIKEKFTNAISNVTPADLYDGQKSIALRSLPCLFDDYGKKMITCTDPSRDMFMFVDKDGSTVKDKKCRKVANIIEPIATAKTDELIKADLVKREKSSRLSFLIKSLKDQEKEIGKLSEHQKGYDEESKEWNRIESDIHKKLELNIIYQQEINKLRIDGVFPKMEGEMETCDEKLLNAAEDIKSMKTDCTIFSKTIFEHL